MTRGDYQRWMQDARGWGKDGLRACARSSDPYRARPAVDEDLRAAARAVLAAVVDDAPLRVVSALEQYVRRGRARNSDGG